MDATPSSCPIEVDALQPTSERRSSIDGGIAMNPLSPGPVRRNLHRRDLVVALLAGVMLALVMAANFERTLRRNAPSNAIGQAPTDPKALAANLELPVPLATSPAVPVASTPAPVASGWAARRPSAMLPVATLTGESRAKVSRAGPESKQVNSGRVPSPAVPVFQRKTTAYSLAPTMTNPDTKASLDEKIRELQGREQTHHP
jgi:hypothetical protein